MLISFGDGRLVRQLRYGFRVRVVLRCEMTGAGVGRGIAVRLYLTLGRMLGRVGDQLVL